MPATVDDIPTRCLDQGCRVACDRAAPVVLGCPVPDGPRDAVVIVHAFMLLLAAIRGLRSAVWRLRGMSAV